MSAKEDLLVAEERELSGVVALHNPHGIEIKDGRKIILERFHFATNLVEARNAVSLVTLLGRDVA